MKFGKKGIAILLAVLMALPSMTAFAAEPSVSGGDTDTVSDGDAGAGSGTQTPNEVSFNVGASVAVGSNKYFLDDGSYTINLSAAVDDEGNKAVFTFPYEVQFKVGDEITTKWFDNPDSTVEVGGHQFALSIPKDDEGNDLYNKFVFNIGGDKVTLYPEEKSFPEEAWTKITVQPSTRVRLMMARSNTSLILPVTQTLSVNLSGYAPVELSMVSIDAVLGGHVTAGDKVAWSASSYYSDINREVTISGSGSSIDLVNVSTLDMVVGNEADQLNSTNARYIVNISTGGSQTHWLVPTLKSTGGAAINVNNYNYSKSAGTSSGVPYKGYERIYVNENDMPKSSTEAYVTLTVDSAHNYSTIKAFEGGYTDPTAISGTDITAQLFGSGYRMKRNGTVVTLVCYDATSKVTGCLPIKIYISTDTDGVQTGSLYDENGLIVYNSSSSSTSDGLTTRTYELYKGYAVNGTYYLKMRYETNGTTNNGAVTAAYAGNYASAAAAQSAGASDIKAALFGGTGYAADYSNGVYFTIIAGTSVEKFLIKTTAGLIPEIVSFNRIDTDPVIDFTGLKDAAGNTIAGVYSAPYNLDNYGEYNFRTLIVPAGTDLTNVAPVFTTSDANTVVKVEGSSTAEVSGETKHDLSSGLLQYSVLNGDYNRSYWLQIIKADTGAYRLYVNSLKDVASNTTVSNGVVTSTREIMLDGSHNSRHDIMVVNTGSTVVPSLKVELSSDSLELDEYWTLSGNHDLAALTTTVPGSDYQELPNIAMIRLKAKSGVTSGTEVEGTLTFKSGTDTLMVLNLTGLIGDPIITTTSIPEAVKYVPYGPVLQNNNKYRKNVPIYELYSGTLPEGLEVRPNGEIYGVPKETGSFTFKVRMRNTYPRSSTDTKEYTLVVKENTDANVDGATDTSYTLLDRIGNVDGSAATYMLRSQGALGEFKYVFYDGVKLTEGTDFTKSEGSTRITIQSQTLQNAGNGTHTIGIEFRDSGDNLKRAAQNIKVTGSSGSSSSSSSDDSSDSSSGDSGSTGDSADGIATAGSPALTVSSFTPAGGAAAKRLNATAIPATQGPKALAAFRLAKPAGFSEQGTYDLAVDGEVGHTLKSGTLVLNLPPALVQKGRTFAVIFVDNTGVPHYYVDTDSNDNTFTANINLTGYAFMLVFSDARNALNARSAFVGRAFGQSGSYIVQRGDALSILARRFGVQLRHLVQLNRITDPNLIYTGQTINY
ncbi:MAG: LysM peptidoglycan-binding domain-containing protein [Lachnospiraceae bacterium]|nr:LysM peptidoglycan-binding domain-containing protein [Lachnospiraceae bacterium]